jgi:hypothetical protein
MRYAIRRISPTGALLYGLLLGLAGWIIPGLLLGWGVRAAVLGLRGWLSGLQVTLPLPFGESLALDLSAILPLSDTQARLAALAGQETALVVAVALGTAAAGMLLTGLATFLGALFYNLLAALFGGIAVSLDTLDAPGRPSAVEQLAPVTARPRPAAAAPLVTTQSRPEPTRSGSPATSAWLTSTSDGHERRALRADVTRIGSAPENDIVLPGLAPQHAEIRRESGRYLIYDLGSHRTWVNDAQVAAVHMLKDGFRLQLGQAEFVVHIPGV